MTQNVPGNEGATRANLEHAQKDINSCVDAIRNLTERVVKLEVNNMNSAKIQEETNKKLDHILSTVNDLKLESTVKFTKIFGVVGTITFIMSMGYMVFNMVMG